MDHPADDVDLAVAASHTHAYVRALIALTERLGRAAPPGVHRAAATLAAWILTLDPDDERLRRAPRLLADGEWRQLRVDKALEVVVCGWSRLPTPTSSPGGSGAAGRAGCGLPDHRRHGAASTAHPRSLAASGSGAGRATAWLGPGDVPGGTGRRRNARRAAWRRRGSRRGRGVVALSLVGTALCGSRASTRERSLGILDPHHRQQPGPTTPRWVGAQRVLHRNDKARSRAVAPAFHQATQALVVMANTQVKKAT
jgi:hypothetical protein